MASNISASGAEQFVEERLLNGLFTGPLLQHKELLNMLEDVDVRYPRQRTLLHVGVGLGKADWVEELLARGADTYITDDSQQNALSSAEEMVRQFPEDVERSKVLSLVTLVHRRDQVILRRLEASLSRSTDHVTPVAYPECDIASLKSSVDLLRREMKSLVRQLSSSLEELKAQVCGGDAMLHFLEDAVMTAVEDVTSIKIGLGGEAYLSQPTSDLARARQECVDAMMRKTRIVYGSGVEEMRRLYERLYDGDGCTACIIKYLCGNDRVKVLVDLESEGIGRMKEKFVDLDGTQRMGRVSRSFCDFESETVYWSAMDCSGDREKVVCSMLACALLQLSLKLVFGNEGRPYNNGDVEREREWMRAIEEAEERRKGGEGLHWYINYALGGIMPWMDMKKRVGGLDLCIKHALNQKTLKATVCWLAAAVPWIITKFGSTEGRSFLQKNFPLLFSLYSNNVMGTLLASAKR